MGTCANEIWTLLSPGTNCSDDFLDLQKPFVCKALEKSKFVSEDVLGDPTTLTMSHLVLIRRFSEHVFLRKKLFLYV